MAEENISDLLKIVERLAREENPGRGEFFEERLAAVFGLRGANGGLQGGEIFLKGLKGGGEAVCGAKSIEISAIGQSRALATFVFRIRDRTINYACKFARNE